MRSRRWLVFLVGGIVGTIAAGVSGSFIAAALAAQVFGWWGSIGGFSTGRKLPGAAGKAWKWFGTAGIAFLVAGIVRTVHGMLIDEDRPFPSPADIFITGGQLALIIGGILLGHLRSPARDRAAIIDGAIVAVGAATITWAMLLGPYVADGTVALDERVINTASSLLLTVFLAAIVRLAFGPGARNVSYYLLAGAVALIFIQDTSVTLETVGGPNATIGRALAPAIYVFFGAAAMHPDVHLMTEPPRQFDVSLSWRRITLLVGALLIAPAMICLQLVLGWDPNIVILTISSILLSMLVLARLIFLVRDREQATKREQTLREASARFAVASDRESAYGAAMEAVERLASGVNDLRVALVAEGPDALEILHVEGYRAEEAVDRIPRAGLPPALADALGSRDVADLVLEPVVLPGGGEPARPLLVIPLASQRSVRTAMLISTDKPLPAITRRAVVTLSTTLSLALEAAELSENLHRARSERRFRTLVENSSDLVLVVNDDRRITFVSAASQRLLGMSEDELMDTDPFRLLHEEDRPIAESIVDRRAAVDFIDPIEVRVCHADGAYRWFELVARDLRDDEDIDGIVINCREISDRKDAELQLFRSEARFRALVQGVSDVVAIIDGTGRFTFVSPAVTPMLGFRPEELVGSRWTELLSGDELDAVRVQQPGLVENNPTGTLPPQSLEVRLRAAAGDWHTVDVTITDLRDEPAVQGIVLNARDVTLRKELEHNLRHQALHDALTGLANRTMFAELVNESVMLRTGVAGVLFIDLDDFKTVNDSLGHAVGDELLIGVAERLGQALPSDAVPARLGGDEFAVLVEDSGDEVGPVGLALRLLNDLRRPFRINGREIVITASIGIAAVNDRATSAEVVLRNADMAMYLAKEKGKDRVELFEEQMHASAFERLELKADLARGIEAGQLRLVYQPIVSLQTGRITGVEALVRWDHPQRGRLSPDAFIPLAEDTGLIVPLGQWVMEEACQQLRAWQLSLPTSATVSMAINLSVRQLERETIVDEVAAVVARFGLDPATITLEITETMVMQDTELSKRRLADLQRVGVQLAVDDFGTGYSSLGYMEQFPVDKLKIDRSFVQSLGVRQATPVLQSIIELAQRLGVHIVAEGIERREQLEALQQLGCDLGQGYFFSGPVEADQLGDLLAASLIDGRRFLFQQGGSGLA
ncbi:MAG: EAL domain-containing protein [Acidimicrobiia bacterium]|nr:EAL domain-containing protein [Acidimicrobiia bacterium]